MNTLKGYAKAILGGLLAGLITLAAVAANAKGIDSVTFIQWVIVAISFLGTGTGVYAIPNTPKIGVPLVTNSNNTVVPPVVQ